MNLNSAIDVVSGLVLMYLILSLFCTTLNEIITTLVSLRARTLKKTLQQLIDDPRLKTLFYDHGLIDGAKVATSGGNKAPTAPVVANVVPGPQAVLTQVTNTPTSAATRKDDAWYAFSHPSYLSSTTVASALTGSLLNYINANDPMPVDATFDSLKAAVQNMPVNSNIRDALSACLVDANGSIDGFRERVATWFDNAMARVSGSYTRNLQIISFAVGLLLAAFFNADTLNVAQRLWHDQTLRAVIAQSASKAITGGSETGIKDVPSCEVKGATADISKDITTLCSLNADLRPFPIGWTGTEPSISWDQTSWWLLKMLGILITAVALMKGAPFWFDLLQKIMNFRATGDKPKPEAK